MPCTWVLPLSALQCLTSAVLTQPRPRPCRGAGALSSLRRDWGQGRLGADWAAGDDGVLGLVQYSTYRERDYDAIWDRYAWVRPLSIWFERVGAPTLSTLDCDCSLHMHSIALTGRHRGIDE